MSQITSIGPTNAARLFNARGRSNTLTPVQAAKAANTGPYGQALAANQGAIPIPGGIVFKCPYKIYVVKLDTTFDRQPFPGNFTTFWVQYASANTALASVRFGDQNNDAMKLYPPLKLDGFPCDVFYLTNDTAQAGVTIQIMTVLDVNSLTPAVEVG